MNQSSRDPPDACPPDSLLLSLSPLLTCTCCICLFAIVCECFHVWLYLIILEWLQYSQCKDLVLWEETSLPFASQSTGLHLHIICISHLDTSPYSCLSYAWTISLCWVLGLVAPISQVNKIRSPPLPPPMLDVCVCNICVYVCVCVCTCMCDREIYML